MNYLLHSLPSCFTNSNGGRPQKCTTKMHQTIVSSVYRAIICGSSVLITLTWFRTSSGAARSLTITVDSFSLTIDLSPPSVSSLFRKKRGCKTLPISDHHCKLRWDFSKACFADGMAEPASDFYLAVVQDESTVAFLLSGPTSPSPLSRREHVFGRRSFTTRAAFPGGGGEIEIECSGGAMRVAVDGRAALVVKRLAWKFRGNERIVVGGADVEFYWDVFNWVAGGGHGVFVFQVGEGGVWAEMGAEEKKMMRRSSASAAGASPAGASSAGSWSSVMQWSEEGSWCSSLSSASSRTSSSSSWSTSGGNGRRSGFSLMLYAWDLDCSIE